MKKKDSVIIVALCGVQGCCPTVEIKGEDVLIKDDFGGIVRMNKGQWTSIVKQSLKRA